MISFFVIYFPLKLQIQYINLRMVFHPKNQPNSNTSAIKMTEYPDAVNLLLHPLVLHNTLQPFVKTDLIP